MATFGTQTAVLTGKAGSRNSVARERTVFSEFPLHLLPLCRVQAPSDITEPFWAVGKVAFSCFVFDEKLRKQANEVPLSLAPSAAETETASLLLCAEPQLRAFPSPLYYVAFLSSVYLFKNGRDYTLRANTQFGRQKLRCKAGLNVTRGTVHRIERRTFLFPEYTKRNVSQKNEPIASSTCATDSCFLRRETAPTEFSAPFGRVHRRWADSG
ncbi:hypothetical protein TGPRC2_425400 [Toxoplasma gondii TgCatPRC2]|uniref:Uncharacterized protein n=1 Tax=Toxoplasma gondii TgCatPRC2 TaxID=1130821 RepID=A0A151HBI9_TOXGO|nr:hypothetical protein TGPRC2_425400 [Toxoplasma gondii TgCatPRC2]